MFLFLSVDSLTAIIEMINLQIACVLIEEKIELTTIYHVASSFVGVAFELDDVTSFVLLHLPFHRPPRSMAR
jgi:hypothetical protein